MNLGSRESPKEEEDARKNTYALSARPRTLAARSHDSLTTSGNAHVLEGFGVDDVVLIWAHVILAPLDTGVANDEDFVLEIMDPDRAPLVPTHDWNLLRR